MFTELVKDTEILAGYRTGFRAGCTERFWQVPEADTEVVKDRGFGRRQNRIKSQLNIEVLAGDRTGSRAS